MFFLVAGDSLTFKEKEDMQQWYSKIKESENLLSEYQIEDDIVNSSTKLGFLSYSYSWLWFRYGDLESLRNLIKQNEKIDYQERVYYGFSSDLDYEADLTLLSFDDNLISGEWQLWLLNIHNQSEKTVNNSLPYVKFHLKDGSVVERLLPEEEESFLEKQKSGSISRFLWNDIPLLPWYSKRLLILTEFIDKESILMMELVFDKETILIPFWGNFLNF